MILSTSDVVGTVGIVDSITGENQCHLSSRTKTLRETELGSRVSHFSLPTVQLKKTISRRQLIQFGSADQRFFEYHLD